MNQAPRPSDYDKVFDNNTQGLEPDISDESYQSGQLSAEQIEEILVGYRKYWRNGDNVTIWSDGTAVMYDPETGIEEILE